MDISHTPIRVMDPAITDRLRLAFPKKTFTIERVPPELTIKEFERVARLAPFLGLAWSGFVPDGQTNARVTKGDMLWQLLLICKASNTLETRFKGDKLDIGLDAMIDVATVLLNGAIFNDIGTCQVTRANSVIANGWADDSIALARIDFTVKFSSTPAALQIRTIHDFERLNITWNVLPEDPDAPPVTDILEQED